MMYVITPHEIFASCKNYSMVTQKRIEVAISVIVHATEDSDRILDAINDTLGVGSDAFSITKTTGHFDNPITIYDADMSKRDARQFVAKLSSTLSEDDIRALANQIDERTVNSRFHLRIDKQVLVRDKRVEIVGLHDYYLDENSNKDVLKIKIHTPIYSKKDTIRVFEKILYGEVHE